MEKGLRQWKQTVKVFESAITCSVAERGARVWLEYARFCVERSKKGNAKKIYARAVGVVRESEVEQVWAAFLSFLQNGTPDITMAKLKALVNGPVADEPVASSGAGGAGANGMVDQNHVNVGVETELHVSSQPAADCEVEVGNVRTASDLAAERLSKAEEQGTVIDVAIDTDSPPVGQSDDNLQVVEAEVKEHQVESPSAAYTRDSRNTKRQKLDNGGVIISKGLDEAAILVDVDEAKELENTHTEAGAEHGAHELGRKQRSQFLEQQRKEEEEQQQQMRAAVEGERQRRRGVLLKRISARGSRRRFNGTLRPPLPDEDEHTVVFFSAQHAPQGEAMDPATGKPFVRLCYQQQQQFAHSLQQTGSDVLLREHTPPSTLLKPRCPPLLFAGYAGYSDHEEQTAPEIRAELMTALSAALKDGKLFQVLHRT
jgi:hypothetical protein